MSIFDLLFLLSALSSSAVLFTALICALIGQRGRALGILRVWGIAAAIYFAADLASIWLRPLRVLYLHDPQCSDDWCFVVESAGREAPDADMYRVSLKIYSRALRVAQRERGLSVYLTDAAGHRYDPIPRAGDVPLDTLLEPGQSAAASRSFRVPAGLSTLSLSMVHESGFPIGRLIIGRSPFDDRTVVRLD